MICWRELKFLRHKVRRYHIRWFHYWRFYSAASLSTGCGKPFDQVLAFNGVAISWGADIALVLMCLIVVVVTIEMRGEICGTLVVVLSGLVCTLVAISGLHVYTEYELAQGYYKRSQYALNFWLSGHGLWFRRFGWLIWCPSFIVESSKRKPVH